MHLSGSQEVKGEGNWGKNKEMKGQAGGDIHDTLPDGADVPQ